MSKMPMTCSVMWDGTEEQEDWLRRARARGIHVTVWNAPDDWVFPEPKEKATMVICDNCGHRAEHHHGVSEAGYSKPQLACRFETDRYECCTCPKLKLGHDTLLALAVKLDKLEARS